ncbi:MAG TPA: M48 family metallopeptidase [Lysobacter sp.]|nr:M48 family metallopeptidase [Lysobacter sp.]
MRAPPRLLLALAVAALLTACATATSPTGRTQYVGAIPPDQLNQMGAQAFAEAKSKNRVSTDSRQNEYVRCVVDAITRELPAGWQAQWETALFANEEPNAFALPGGKVGVHTGIFKVARTPDQLAAVIAHEIGHVVSRHHDERITRQLGTQTVLGVASMIAGAAYGEGAARTTSQLGGLTAQAAFLLPKSREQESEADIVGQQLMARAGFDPRQAVNLWENMMQASGGRPPEWLSTHPDPSSRLRELGARAEGLMPTYQQARAAGRLPHCS